MNVGNRAEAIGQARRGLEKIADKELGARDDGTCPFVVSVQGGRSQPQQTRQLATTPVPTPSSASSTQSPLGKILTATAPGPGFGVSTVGDRHFHAAATICDLQFVSQTLGDSYWM